MQITILSLVNQYINTYRLVEVDS